MIDDSTYVLAISGKRLFFHCGTARDLVAHGSEWTQASTRDLQFVDGQVNRLEPVFDPALVGFSGASAASLPAGRRERTEAQLIARMAQTVRAAVELAASTGEQVPEPVLDLSGSLQDNIIRFAPLFTDRRGDSGPTHSRGPIHNWIHRL